MRESRSSTNHVDFKMNLAGVSIAGVKKGKDDSVRGHARCIRQYAVPAEQNVKFRFNLAAIDLFIVATVSLP